MLVDISATYSPALNTDIKRRAPTNATTQHNQTNMTNYSVQVIWYRHGKLWNETNLRKLQSVSKLCQQWTFGLLMRQKRILLCFFLVAFAIAFASFFYYCFFEIFVSEKVGNQDFHVNWRSFLLQNIINFHNHIYVTVTSPKQSRISFKSGSENALLLSHLLLLDSAFAFLVRNELLFEYTYHNQSIFNRHESLSKCD